MKPRLRRVTRSVNDTFQKDGNNWPEEDVDLEETLSTNYQSLTAPTYNSRNEECKQDNTIIRVPFQYICRQAMILIPGQCRQ